jgi:putative chitinase
MTDESAPAASGGGSLLNRLSAAAAVLGAFIAVGQGATTWIQGSWQTETERVRKDKEVELAELKDKSALAESYIKLIIDKETSAPDRVMLLGALGELKNHPLQQWAKARFQAIQQSIDNLNKAYAAQFAASQRKTESERQEAGLIADIDALNAEKELNRENIQRTAELQTQIRDKSGLLAIVRANIGIATASIETGAAAISQVKQTGNAALLAVGDSVSALTSKITAELLMGVFPKSAERNVTQNVEFLAAAMGEFKISDPRVAAAIIATIAVETPTFEAYEEPQSVLNTRNDPFDKYDGQLGNSEPGDGARFRGRGYLGLTGRSNYKNMSDRLGLGSRLVDSPEDAKSPEVASRITVAFFADRLPKVQDALDKGNLTYVRRIVAGGSTLLPQFTRAYEKLLSGLSAPVVASESDTPAASPTESP